MMNSKDRTEPNHHGGTAHGNARYWRCESLSGPNVAEARAADDACRHLVVRKADVLQVLTDAAATAHVALPCMQPTVASEVEPFFRINMPRAIPNKSPARYGPRAHA
jgi:hypothetical protein